MLRYMLISVFVVGMVGSSGVAFAQVTMGSSGCEATIKCVCEGPLGTRVVPCPTYYENPAFFEGHGPQGTLGVDCSIPLHSMDTLEPALCEDLNFKCIWWKGEHRNCLLTLPLSVATQPRGCCTFPTSLTEWTCIEVTHTACDDPQTYDGFYCGDGTVCTDTCSGNGQCPVPE
jgi:hypothetical protein